MVKRPLLAAIFAFLLAACSDEPTQIIVAVDTDLLVPDEIDSIHFEVTGPDGREQTSTASLVGEGAPSLPRTLALTRRDGPLGPYLIRVTGLRGAGEFIERRASVSFIEGRSVLLVLRLLRSCRTAGCTTDQTCDLEGCRAVEVDPSELLDWSGKPEPIDGSLPIDLGVDMPVADMGVDMPVVDMGVDMPIDMAMDACAVPEVCNGRDDNCDGVTDEGFDLLSDVENCGSCGHDCPPLPVGSGSRACVNGQCTALCIGVDSADCNQIYGDGCESPLDSPLTCGSCLTMCMLQHATAGCAVSMSSAMCSVSACDPPYDDCDGNARNGCETNLDTNVNHCGACTGDGTDCPNTPDHGTSRCAAGSCVIDCDPGYANCDGRADTGCEANLNDPETCGSCATVCPSGMPFCEGTVFSGFTCVDNCTTGTELCGTSCVDTTTAAEHCGACDSACPSGANSQPRCTASTCSLACDIGFFDCNMNPTDGCEQNVRLPDHCGTCTNVCNLPHVDTHTCDTGSCGIAQCALGYADCNGLPADGCETSIADDEANCGMCERACPGTPAHASSVCIAGSCELSCDPGFQDCGPDSGCETALSSPMNCGACGNECSGSDTVCAAGMSGTYSCEAVCSGGASVHLCGMSCVDTDSDPLNCNMCGTACPARPQAAPICASGACDISCDMNYGDCNMMQSDGCERALLTDVDYCGNCMTSCPTPDNAMRTCVSGACGYSCESGYGDCNMLGVDGCESPTNTIANCGACGDSCPTTGANVDTATCDGTACHLVCTSSVYGDCDGDLLNGCEASFDDDPLHCGDCATECPDTASTCCGGTCCDGTCELGACVPPTMDD